MLDQEFITPARPTLLERFQLVFAIFEIGLWLLFMIGAFFRLESWEYASEIMIMTGSTLILLYLAVPFLMFRSKGVKRIIGSYGIGITMALATAAALFVIESWQGAQEMQIVTFLPCLLGIIPVAILMVMNLRWNPGDKFYMFLLLRLMLAALVTAGPVVAMFVR